MPRFDRNTLWRNGLEYAAGIVLLLWAGYRALHGSRLTATRAAIETMSEEKKP